MSIAGIPVEFLFFALTLLGVALFHHYTLYVALTGMVVIAAYKLGFTDFSAFDFAHRHAEIGPAAGHIHLARAGKGLHRGVIDGGGLAQGEFRAGIHHWHLVGSSAGAAPARLTGRARGLAFLRRHHPGQVRRVCSQLRQFAKHP